MFWPLELSQQEAELSIVPKLIETQNQFVSILSIDVSNIEGLFQIINASQLSANLFLKHLVILSDFGGEMLQRLNSRFHSIFPSGNLEYIWHKGKQIYEFECLPCSGKLTNSKLGIDGKKLLQSRALSPLHKDIIAILLFGSNATQKRTAEILAKCEIGNYLGKPDALTRFLKQRYIWVSRITSGAQSNTLGNTTQNFVKKYIEEHLRINNIQIERDSHLPGIKHTGDDSEMFTTFDIVASEGTRFIAIEVSFQVTTNSVIERKAGQARSRFEQIERSGYKIAYVIDGAGNFERETALRTLCYYSHCTVTFCTSELDRLCDFLEEYFTTD
ncbi:restriction endonuclease [Oscillatoria sp. FACHB-1406]|nr:restriction endonuclease [Oscillatoria sp. FACHB-1406]MBD2576550.1 restriction endonuclease [Oscillatoria sp. FACHB-1406]